VQHLGDDQPFFGLQPPGLDGQSQPLTRVEDLAAYFAAQIKAFQPNGPYLIAGYCAGGAIAFELARQLVRSGSTVNLVALFGAPYATAYRLRSQIRLRLAAECARVTRHARALASLPGEQRWSYMREKVKLILGQSEDERHDPVFSLSPSGGESVGVGPSEHQKSKISGEVLAQRIKVQRATFAALARYTPGHFPGRLVLLVPCKAWVRSGRHPLRWGSLADRAEEHFGPDDCHTDVMLLEPYAPIFAELFAQNASRNA
jgi:thioesterase domain-containing protein